MESPIGYSSDFWLPLQEKLSSLTKVFSCIIIETRVKIRFFIQGMHL
jgi:hypothetical protein